MDSAGEFTNGELTNGEPTNGHRSLYRYRELKTGHIRLVNVHPGKSNDPIRCDIIHAPLNGKGSRYYEAVSYAWGDVHSQSSIRCGSNGDEIIVTDNCVSAIRRLRFEDQER